jgi:plasmid stability protein
MPTETANKPVKLVLTESEHAALRVVSAMSGRSMSEHVKALVRESIKDARKKNPKIFSLLA